MYRFKKRARYYFVVFQSLRDSLCTGRPAAGGPPVSSIRFMSPKDKEMRSTSVVALLFLIGSTHFALAECLPSASYIAAVKVIQCEEDEPGEVFISGEIRNVIKMKGTVPELQSVPAKGQQFLFYKFFPPLVRDHTGKLQKRTRGYCKSMKHGAILKGIISRPCCDANYAFCKRPVDFLLNEPSEEEDGVKSEF
ncbi:MAG: hypothetical protein KCHDKBKB_01299 [Elusimicrobia bacterium]|nr:hypothetical protein [Elusimicrobiota bacterium]